MAAAAEVLDLPELLENVLVQLPMYDLLLHANRVCKSWHDNMKASPRIRRALFFELPPGEPLIFSSKPRPNPLLDEAHPASARVHKYHSLGLYQLPPTDPTQATEWGYMWALPSPAPRIPVAMTLNPVFRIFEEVGQENVFDQGTCFPSDELPESWLRPEASWRRMFMADRNFIGRIEIHVESGDKSLTVAKQVSSRDWRLGKIFEWGWETLVEFPRMERMKGWLDTYQIDVNGMILWGECADH